MRTTYITLLKELTQANPRLRFVWLVSVAFTVLASVSIPFSKEPPFAAIAAVLLFFAVMFYVVRSSSETDDKTLSLPGYMLVGAASLLLWASSIASFFGSLGNLQNSPETFFANAALPSGAKTEKMSVNSSFNPQDTLDKVQDKQNRISSYFSNLKNNPEFSKNRVDEVLMKTLVREHEAYTEQLDGEIKAGLPSEKLEASYSSIKIAEDSLFVEAENIYRRYLDRN